MEIILDYLSRLNHKVLGKWSREMWLWETVEEWSERCGVLLALKREKGPQKPRNVGDF